MSPAQGGDGYKIYDPSTKHMSVTRDVHFLEGRAKPELIRSPLLERQQDPIPDMDDSGEAGSDEPDEPVLPTITLSPLPQRRSTRQQGARGPTPAQSPILQSGDRAQGGHTEDTWAGDEGDDVPPSSPGDGAAQHSSSAPTPPRESGDAQQSRSAPTSSRGSGGAQQRSSAPTPPGASGAAQHPSSAPTARRGKSTP